MASLSGRLSRCFLVNLEVPNLRMPRLFDQSLRRLGEEAPYLHNQKCMRQMRMRFKRFLNRGCRPANELAGCSITHVFFIACINHRASATLDVNKCEYKNNLKVFKPPPESLLQHMTIPYMCARKSPQMNYIGFTWDNVVHQNPASPSYCSRPLQRHSPDSLVDKERIFPMCAGRLQSNLNRQHQNGKSHCPATGGSSG